MKLIHPGSILETSRGHSVYDVLVTYGAPTLDTDAGFIRGGLVFSVGRRPYTGRRVAVAYDGARKCFIVLAADLSDQWPTLPA